MLLNSEGRRLRLSDFQLRSIRQILSDLASRCPRGLVVGAGTGSGKTLAFYFLRCPGSAVYVTIYAGQRHWRFIRERSCSRINLPRPMTKPAGWTDF